MWRDEDPAASQGVVSTVREVVELRRWHLRLAGSKSNIQSFAIARCGVPSKTDVIPQRCARVITFWCQVPGRSITTIGLDTLGFPVTVPLESHDMRGEGTLHVLHFTDLPNEVSLLTHERTSVQI